MLTGLALALGLATAARGQYTRPAFGLQSETTFDKEYFDGDRTLGLGGYYYAPRFFSPVVEDLIAHYELAEDASILDVGCAKGFMLHDFRRYLPGCQITGLDISRYCLENAMENVKAFLRLGTCEELPYESHSYDLVVSIDFI